MKELIDALANCNRSSSRLVDIIGDVMQDGQYSPGAHELSLILMKYEDKYGHLTLAEIRALSLET
jgi:hypothetical protein